MLRDDHATGCECVRCVVEFSADAEEQCGILPMAADLRERVEWISDGPEGEVVLDAWRDECGTIYSIEADGAAVFLFDGGDRVALMRDEVQRTVAALSAWLDRKDG